MAPPPPLCWADAPPYHYHGDGAPQPQEEEKGGGDGSGSGPRSLWIGGLLHWMNEDYLYCCFTRSPELLSLVIKRSKQTGHSDGFGFLNFADHTSAYQILKSYNGQNMPNSNLSFYLNWATQQPAPDKAPDQVFNLNCPTQHQDAPHTNGDDASSNQAIFVGDLAFDVTDFMLHHLFKTRYPSVKSAKVICDKVTARSKGYGFVQFGDANEQLQAMTEMNGVYCSTRPMRIRPVPNKKSTYTFRPNSVHHTQGIDTDQDPNNSKLFVGCLDRSVTDDDLLQAFSPYGELVDVKVLTGKDCGFVTYSNRASAEEALRMLNGSELGGSTIKLSWGRCSGNKQDQQNGGRHGHPHCFDPSGFCWSAQGPYAYAQAGHPGYGFYQQVQVSMVQ